MKKIILMTLMALFVVPVAIEAAAANPYKVGTREYNGYQQQLLKRQQQQKQQRDASGVYKRYKPTPVITPQAKYQRPQETVVEFHKPSWAVALKGGLGLPLADAAQVTDGGFGTNADVYFRATSRLSLDIFGAYLAAPYSDTTAPDPLTLAGAGVRALFHPYKTKKMVSHIGAGLGYMSAHRATAQPVLGPLGLALTDPITGEIINKVIYESSAGIAFTGAVGATYEIIPKVGLQVELSVYSVSLNGGTSDSVTMAQAGLGIQYSF